MTKKISGVPVIFVAGILEKKENGVKKILIQTRWKPKITLKYSGLFEIPGGRINNYENIFEALAREVKEECGLKIISCRNFFREKLFKVNKLEQTMIFQPFICQQVLTSKGGIPWFGFVFICEVQGKPKMQKGETKDPRWVSIKELKKLLDKQPNKIFPHQYQILKYYINNTK
ncbi:NUDIX hydrolase [Candidatus Nomurabacteria bacterium]|nr:NUDIX hydrolase [Candidatus Nomurabacteria bacterium]